MTKAKNDQKHDTMYQLVTALLLMPPLTIKSIFTFQLARSPMQWSNLPCI